MLRKTCCSGSDGAEFERISVKKAAITDEAKRINAKMVQLEDRKAELERQPNDAESPPPLLDPERPSTANKSTPSTTRCGMTPRQRASRPAKSCVPW
jgi:hypothetical protein